MRAATFTTYINAQTDPGLEQAFNRQTRLAQNSYAQIQRSAEAATRATAALIGGRVTTRNTGQDAATRAATASAAAAERQIARTTVAIQREGVAAERAARANSNLTRSLNTTSTSLAVVEGRMSPLAGRMVTVARAAEQLSSVQLGIAGIGAGVVALGRIANNYTLVESRLKPLFTSQTDVNKAVADVAGIAQRSRSALQPIADLYARITNNANDLALSQRRVGRITELASKAATLSGGTSQAREAGLNQFAQALGSGRLNGDELRSILENIPELARAIAQGFETADGKIGVSIGSLRKMGSEGELSAAKITAALERSGTSIETRFARLAPTLSTATTSFGNNLTVMVGRLDQSVGFTRNLAESIQIVGDNLRAVTALAVGAAAAFAAIRLAPAVGRVGGAFSDRIEALKREAALERGNAIQNQHYAREEAQASARSVVDTRSRIQALGDEQRVINRQVEELRKKRNEAQATVTAARASAFGRARGVGDPVGGISTAQAEQRAQLANRRLAEAETRQRGIRSALTAETNSLIRANVANVAATDRYHRTLQQGVPRLGAVGTAMRGVRAAAGSLVSFLGGPWGIAFAVATTALYLFATAESQAERNSRVLEDAQRKLADAIDFNTGKVKEANAAKLAGLRIDGAKGLEASRANYRTARREVGSLANSIGSVSPVFVGSGGASASASQGQVDLSSLTPTQRRAYDLLRNYGQGRGGNSIQRLVGQIGRLADADPSLRPLYDRLVPRGTTVVNAARDNNKLVGSTRLIAGENSAANIQLADRGYVDPSLSGDLRGGARKSKQALALDAAAAAATSDLERARIEERKIRSEGPQAGETDAAYTDRLALAIKNTKDLAAAEKEAKAARTAAAAQARKEARDALTDQKDAIEERRDAALLDLAERKPTLSQDEFLQARLAILKTYDDEMNAADASSRATSTAAKQQIADANAVAAAAARAGEKRRDILGGYEDQPKAVTRANDQADDLQRMVDTAVDGAAFIGKTKAEIEAISKINPLGTGIYTQEMADADTDRIWEGVRRPLRELTREHERTLAISSLQLQGRENEAEALRRTIGLYDQLGSVGQADFDRILRQVQEEERVNDLLEDRRRIVGRVEQQVEGFRSSLEGLLTDLPVNPRDAGRKFAGDFFASVRSAAARSLTDRLTQGTDKRIRDLLTGKQGVDGALRDYIGTMDSAGDASKSLATSMREAATTINTAAARIARGPDAADAPGSALAPSPAAARAAGTGSNALLAAAGQAIAISAFVRARSQASDASGDGSDIVVTGQRPVRTGGRVQQLSDGVARLGKYDVAREQGAVLGQNIASALGVKDGSFFSKIGSKFGQAFQGAGEGAIASGMVKALGIKQDATGAQLGGAIGSFVPIPGASIIGGILGGTLGGLIKGPTRSGYASLTTDAYGNGVSAVSGGRNSSGRQEEAVGYGKGVLDSLDQIASALGGRLAGGVNFGTIGTQGDKFVYDPDGAGARAGLKVDTLEAAVTAAIGEALSRGIITGISDASKRILASGQDIGTAIDKAVAIESIPKRLMQRQDPARYAVTELNREFETLIAYLKEGGATAEQFADAQKLYDLERADAIEQATQQISSALDQFLKDMVSSSASPLNKRTTYENASGDLAKFQADIASGKAVDQNSLISAARNYQDASRALNGSNEAFFADFEMLRQLLTKARDNAGVKGVTNLPSSPFEKPGEVQFSLDQLRDQSIAATRQQTDVIGGKLDDLIAVTKAVNNGYGEYARPDGSSIAMLPGFASL